MSNLIRIGNIEEYDKFKKSYKRSVIMYSAKWCDACKDIEPLYGRIAKRYHKRIAFGYCDIDKADLDFTAIPIFVSFKNGRHLNSIEGADPAQLRKLIKEAIVCK